VVVREMFARMGIDLDESGVEAADAAFGLLEGSLIAIGTAVVAAGAAIAGMVGHTVEAASKINDLSQRTGVSTDELQSLGYAAKLGGVDMDSLAMSLQFLDRNLAAAARGEGEASKAFARAGISVRDSNGHVLSAHAAFTKLADKMKSMPDGAEKTALAMSLMGRAGAQMIPTLNEGGEGLSRLEQRARDLGFVMDNETIAAGDALGDSIDELKMAFQGVAYTIAGPLLKPLTAVVQSFISWIAANRQLVAQKVHAAIEVVGKAIRFVWQAAQPWLAILKAIVTNTLLLKTAAAVLAGVLIYQLGTAIGSAVAGLATMLAGVSALTLAQVGAAISSFAIAAGWVALAAIVALVIEDIYTFLEGGDSLIGELGVAWTKFLDEFLAYDGKDPWFTAAVKSVFRSLTDLQTSVPEAIAFWKKQIGPFWDWMTEKIETVTRGLRVMFEAAALPFRAAAVPLQIGARLAGIGGGEDVLSGNTGQRAQPLVVNPGQRASVAPQFHANITVHGGGDPHQTAGAVREHMDEWFNEKMRNGFEAVK
jgi:hypothetical protein